MSSRLSVGGLQRKNHPGSGRSPQPHNGGGGTIEVRLRQGMETIGDQTGGICQQRTTESLGVASHGGVQGALEVGFGPWAKLMQHADGIVDRVVVESEWSMESLTLDPAGADKWRQSSPSLGTQPSPEQRRSRNGGS